MEELLPNDSCLTESDVERYNTLAQKIDNGDSLSPEDQEFFDAVEATAPNAGADEGDEDAT